MQERIAEQTEIPAGSQLILWNDRELSDVIDPAAAVQSYPKVITKTRIYVINRLSVETGMLRVLYIRKSFSILSEIVFI